MAVIALLLAALILKPRTGADQTKQATRTRRKPLLRLPLRARRSRSC
jgi:hypothetical protein